MYDHGADFARLMAGRERPVLAFDVKTDERVEVCEENDPRRGQCGVVISVADGDECLVEFMDGTRRRFPARCLRPVDDKYQATDEWSDEAREAAARARAEHHAARSEEHRVNGAKIKRLANNGEEDRAAASHARASQSHSEAARAHETGASNRDDVSRKAEEHSRVADTNTHSKRLLGNDESFEHLEHQLARKEGVQDPKALAAYIGREHGKIK